MKGSTNAQPSVPISNQVVYQNRQTVSLSSGTVIAPLSWTCTADGAYLVEGTVETQDAPVNTNLILGLGIDNPNGEWSQQAAGGGPIRINACRIYGLSSGQTVTLNIYSSSAVSTTDVVLSIVRLT